MEIESGWSIEDILARLTALEALVRDSDSSLFDGLVKRVDELEGYCAACKAHDGVCERLQALEEFRKGFPDDNDPHIDHPDSPNCGTFQPIDDGWKAEKAERDRQARWHDTYNAVRGGMEACTQEVLNVDDAHDYAVEAADRAHGPLEGKAEVTYPTHPRPPEPTPEMLASPEFEAVWQVIKNWEVDHGGGMRSGATGNDVRAILDALARVPMTQDEIDDVGALVKAARKHVNEEHDTQYAMPTDELEAALKPFEVTP